MSDHSINLNPLPQLQPTFTPEVDVVRAFYNQRPGNFSEFIPDNLARHHNLTLATRANIQSEDCILDAGCGVGIPAIHIAEHFPEVRIEGITASDVEASEAHQRIIHANLAGRIRVQVGDFHHLPFSDETFDVVFFNDSIKYSHNLPQLLIEVDRVLRPGGKLYITDLFCYEPPLSEQQQQALAKFSQEMGHGSNITSLSQMAESIEQAEFQSVKKTDLTGQLLTQDYRQAYLNSLAPDAPLFYGEVKAYKTLIVSDRYIRGKDNLNMTLSQTHHEEISRFIGEHKQAFDIDNLYPLNLFEEVASRLGHRARALGCCCNIERDKLYPARFYFVFQPMPSKPEIFFSDLRTVLSFIERTKERPEVQINDQSLQQFLATGLDASKVKGISFGVDIRPDLRESRIKLSLLIENYPEKMETAISLCGENRDWKKLIVNRKLLVGFDFFFNNRSSVEVYPTFYREDLQRFEVKKHLEEILPPRAFKLLPESEWFQIGISNDNESDVLYFNDLICPNSFIDNLANQLTNRVHAYYRHQPFKTMLVGIPMAEFSAWSIQKVKLYYAMIDTRSKL